MEYSMMQHLSVLKAVLVMPKIHIILFWWFCLEPLYIQLCNQIAVIKSLEIAGACTK